MRVELTTFRLENDKLCCYFNALKWWGHISDDDYLRGVTPNGYVYDIA